MLTPRIIPSSLWGSFFGCISALKASVCSQDHLNLFFAELVWLSQTQGRSGCCKDSCAVTTSPLPSHTDQQVSLVWQRSHQTGAILLHLSPAFFPGKLLLKAVPRQLTLGMVQQESGLGCAAPLASPALPGAAALAGSAGRHKEVSSPWK